MLHNIIRLNGGAGDLLERKAEREASAELMRARRMHYVDSDNEQADDNESSEEYRSASEQRDAIAMALWKQYQGELERRHGRIGRE